LETPAEIYAPREKARKQIRPDLLPIASLLVEVPGAAGVEDSLPLSPVALGALLLLVEFLALRLQSGQDIKQVGLLRLGRYKVLKRILKTDPQCFDRKKRYFCWKVLFLSFLNERLLAYPKNSQVNSLKTDIFYYICSTSSG
jgi:hypothetical protein